MIKKFIPHILIVAMIGTFAWLSFASSISNVKQVEAENSDLLTEITKVFGRFGWQTSVLGQTLDAVGVTDSSNWGDWGKVADASIGQIIAWISDFTWRISARLFTMAGYLLDYAVDFSVKDFKKHIDGIEVINIGYKIILNVANMLFIFILLYIAIKTILGMGGDIKKLLTNIIVVALFINFSLFMTKTIIDASNILAMGFYNGVQTEIGKAETDGVNKQVISVGSVSTAMMAGLKLQTMIPSEKSDYNKEDSSKGLTYMNIAMNNFGGSALFLVSAFVFLSAAILFVVRFVALLFYMLFSPVAFLGMILPEFKEYSSKWWKGLQSQALFAPAFLFMAYLISAIVNSKQLWTAVGGTDKANFFDAFSSTRPSAAFPILMNYVILTALMIGALIIAKKMAGEGSAGVLKYTGKFQHWAQGVAGRNTLGRAAYLAGNNKYMGKLMAKSPILGTFVKSKFDSVADTKFGSKTGYATELKKNIEQKKKMAEFAQKYATKETGESLRKEERLLDEKNEIRTRQIKKTNDVRMEQGRLADIASRTMSATDLDAANLAYENLQKEEALLKKAENDIAKINTNIDNLKSAQNNIGYIAKRQYAKNVEFDSSILNKIFPSYADAATEIRKGKKKGAEEVIDMIEKLAEEKANERVELVAQEMRGTSGTSGGGAGGKTP